MLCRSCRRTLGLSVGKRHHSVGPARTRFAPSPTGSLHLGSLRTALYNYLWARKTGGQFILRIEDTDQTRLVEGAEASLYESLSWAGLEVSEGPSGASPLASPQGVSYRQSERLSIYTQHAKTLVDNGTAYRCFCSADRLADLRSRARKTGQSGTYDRRCTHVGTSEAERRAASGEPHVVRLRMPDTLPAVDDLVHGQVSFSRHQTRPGHMATDTYFDDPVLVKSDGFPTYHLANVVDDKLMEITHVIRGEEWLPSTPKHLALYGAFGWGPPLFAHVPLLASPGGAKLSKRRGDTTVQDYRARGYLPEAILNYLALLGWNAGGSSGGVGSSGEVKEVQGIAETEVMSLEEMVQRFDLSSITRGAAVVTPEKLTFLQKQHYVRLARTADGMSRLVESAQSTLRQAFPEQDFDDAYVARVITALKDRLADPLGIPELGSYFFQTPKHTGTPETDKLLRKWRSKSSNLADLLEVLRSRIESMPVDHWQAAVDEDTFGRHFEDTVLRPQSDQEATNADVLAALRYALAGAKSGAPVKQILHILGRDRALDRMTTAVDAARQ
ncbi:Glutamate--tRNA ligase mitochondrial [Savitreella phatthalungensis]